MAGELLVVGCFCCLIVDCVVCCCCCSRTFFMSASDLLLPPKSRISPAKINDLCAPTTESVQTSSPGDPKTWLFLGTSTPPNLKSRPSPSPSHIDHRSPPSRSLPSASALVTFSHFPRSPLTTTAFNMSSKSSSPSTLKLVSLFGLARASGLDVSVGVGVGGYK